MFSTFASKDIYIIHFLTKKESRIILNIGFEIPASDSLKALYGGIRLSNKEALCRLERKKRGNLNPNIEAQHKSRPLGKQ